LSASSHESDFQPTLLIILDGYGIAEDPSVSAIERAKKPYLDHLFATYPHTQLTASGSDVGLPEGQFGNSEVGHLNIGAGRIVWQELSRINKSIADGSFFENEVLTEAMRRASDRGRIHLMGLFSDGGVHSHNDHLYALLEMCNQHNISTVNVHAFTDGRDTSPTGGIEYARQFQQKADEIGAGRLATVIGRYYAMDRDQRWERTDLAYRLLTENEGQSFDSSEELFTHWYEQDITDEFIKPSVLVGDEDSRIQKDDVVIFFNIRGDRARQITRAFTEDDFDAFEVNSHLDLNYYTFTSYDARFDVQVAFPPLELKNTLGEVVSKQGIKQLRIAETEKYPHVTYFFNGGNETPYPNEDRILIPSPKVPTYDLQPEMSAPEVADKLCEALTTDKYGFVVLNFANPDMVGHTGDMNATVRAIETIDEQLRNVVETATNHHYRILIIADHGNADKLLNEDGSPHTAHTTAPVPALFVNVDEPITLKKGILADVAPTLLKMMHVPQPDEMTGQPLYK
jgi:2,3-bisphosphoglycerate-independent phosphoglycerate mutase